MAAGAPAVAGPPPAAAALLLEPVERQFPELAPADLRTLAGAVALREMGGPAVAWRPGRARGEETGPALETGPTPTAPWAGSAKQLRRDFRRLGRFSDREIVALVGLAREVAGGEREPGAPWTQASVPSFNNLYFEELLQSFKKRSKRWLPAILRRRREDAPPREGPGGLAALPVDAALTSDWKFWRQVRRYARDEEALALELAGAFGRLLDAGAASPPPEARWWFSRRRPPPAAAPRASTSPRPPE